MDDVVITWSFENWVTIFLMVLIGAVVLNFATTFLARNMGR